VTGPRPDSRTVAERRFPGAEVQYVEAFERMADLFDTLGDQRPSTCGAYAARYLLAPLGHLSADDEDTTREDFLAYLAGTVLEAAEVGPAEEAGAAASAAGLSDAEALERFPDTYYGWPLRSSADPAVAGTSPTGIARAIAVASGGALTTLPVPARDVGSRVLLDAGRWAALLDVLGDHLVAWRIHPIANYEADQLLDPTTNAYRSGLAHRPLDDLPRDRWGVGHFAGIGGLWRDATGEAWVLVLDTYKDRGWDGYEPQPAELLRRGLVREDGREGGLLLVVPREHLAALHAAVEAIGLEVRMWGNGSLEPEGWTWAIGR
jgi:hypothetical protein